MKDSSTVVMKSLLIFAAISSVCFSATVTLDGEWVSWKSQHGKVYPDKAEESVRRLVWENNYWLVEQHNREEHSFQVAINKFSDLVSLYCYVAINNPSLVHNEMTLKS